MESLPKKKFSDADYRRLADFRYALRRFLEFSEEAAAAEGLTPRQHQALLAIRASPGATATVGRLAERLRIRPNTAVELTDRLVSAGLVVRRVSTEDRRQVGVVLTPAGEEKLEVLSHIHRRELSLIGPEIRGFFRHLEAASSEGEGE